MGFPLAEMIIDRVPLWKIMGKRPPAATFPEHVKDGVQNQVQIDFGRPCVLAYAFKNRSDSVELGGTNVAGIAWGCEEIFRFYPLILRKS